MFRNCCYEDNYIRHEENDRKSFKVWIEKSCSDPSYVFVILTDLQLSLSKFARGTMIAESVR